MPKLALCLASSSSSAAAATAAAAALRLLPRTNHRAGQAQSKGPETWTGRRARATAIPTPACILPRSNLVPGLAVFHRALSCAPEGVMPTVAGVNESHPSYYCSSSPRPRNAIIFCLPPSVPLWATACSTAATGRPWQYGPLRCCGLAWPGIHACVTPGWWRPDSPTCLSL